MENTTHSKTNQRLEHKARLVYTPPVLTPQGKWTHQTGVTRPGGGTGDGFVPPVFRE